MEKRPTAFFEPVAIEVDIVSSDEVDVDGAEMDEMWSFVHDKSQQYWLWWTIDHNTGVPLAYCFGTRGHKYLDELQRLLSSFNIALSVTVRNNLLLQTKL